MQKNNCCNMSFLPLNLCQFSKLENMNRNIFLRNFPSKKMPITYDFRPNILLCKGGTNINQVYDQQLQATNIVNDNKDVNLNKIFNPGMGSYCGFCKVVDNESNLLNLDLQLSGCPIHKYQPDLNCLDCKCKQMNMFCNPEMSKHMDPPQLFNKNLPTCDQDYAEPLQCGKHDNFSEYPSLDLIGNVGYINPANTKNEEIREKIIQDKNKNKKIIVDIQTIDGRNKCTESQNLQICKNDNYMKGNFIGSDKTDIQAQLNGFIDVNNGKNKWIKYSRKVPPKSQKILNMDKTNWNTLPFMLNKEGVCHNDYLSNEQQCQNLYNNMTKVKSLYGMPYNPPAEYRFDEKNDFLIKENINIPKKRF